MVKYNPFGKRKKEHYKLIHSAWSKRSDDTEGAQIDLLISRNDNVVNMCEIKYYGDEFAVNKEYYHVLLH